MTNKAPETLVRERQVLANYAPVHRATWWRWIKAGRAPKPIKLGGGVSAWRLSDIQAWQAGEWPPQAHPTTPA